MKSITFSKSIAKVIPLNENQTMGYFGDKLKTHLDAIGMSQYRLSKLTRVSEPAISNLIGGARKPTEEQILRFASAEAQTGLSLNQLRAWKAIDEYGVETLYEAIKAADPERYERLNSQIEESKEDRREEKLKKGNL